MNKIRKHSGINQLTGRLKKGYRYSGEKLKSGLPRIVKSKIKKNKMKGGKQFTIYDWDDLNETMKKNNVGDIITYVTSNQLGLRKYKIIKDEHNKKQLKEIGDIYGLYENPDHPDHDLWEEDE